VAWIRTAAEATGKLDGAVTLVIAVSNSTADTAGVAPHHLGKVSPGSLEVRVVVGVLGLLLVPTVGGGARELDPGTIVAGCGTDRGKIAARSFLP
jgi:hypothetical protein